MEFKDYYKILGVPRTASVEEIKKAYRRLVRKYHPDVSKEADADARVKEINEAYAVLGDADKRRAYDELGPGWQAGQDFRPPPGWQREYRSGQGGFSQADFSDFFETLFGARGFGRGFADLGGRRPRRPGAGTGGTHRGPRRAGEDQHAAIEIDLEESYHGATRVVTLSVPEAGPGGQVITRQRALNVKIPAGVVDGQKIRLAGQGSPGHAGGPAGDLYLEIGLRPHPLYQVNGRDLSLELPVAPWEAALGARVKVPTLGGQVTLAIPAGAQSGQRLRLRDRGLPGTPPGDQYVVLRLTNPPVDSEAARELFRRMGEKLHFNPRAHLER